MKIAYTGFNALPDEQWKCDIILELTDCMYSRMKKRFAWAKFWFDADFLKIYKKKDLKNFWKSKFS